MLLMIKLKKRGSLGRTGSRSLRVNNAKWAKTVPTCFHSKP